MSDNSKSKDGIFSETDSGKIGQSVRKDGEWKFFREVLLQQINSRKHKLEKNISVMDVGCGTGGNAILFLKKDELTKNHISNFYCVDGSNKLLHEIEKENLANVITLCADLEDLDSLPNSDIIISKYMLHHIREKSSFLKVLANSLNVDGKLVLIDKFPRFGKSFAYSAETILDKLKIKTQLGSHHYCSISKFKKMLKENNLKIVSKKIKPGKRLKNFFVNRAYFVIEKTK